jgi:Asp/Glu/hydantoin racemase
MKLLLINPNISDDVTKVMAEEARRSASPGTEIAATTARFGVLYIENRGESAIAAHAVLDAIAEHGAGADAVIVSAFGDPGLKAARELFDLPVVGLAESAFLMAWTLGHRYSIVAMTPRLGAWFRESAREHGLDGRLASVRALAEGPTDIAKAKEQLREKLVTECLRAVEADGAEVVILGGGPIAGLARDCADRIPVPALDGVSCAVRLAEALVGLKPRAAQRGSFARPAAKANRGLSPNLGAIIDRREGEAR